MRTPRKFRQSPSHNYLPLLFLTVLSLYFHQIVASPLYDLPNSDYDTNNDLDDQTLNYILMETMKQPNYFWNHNYDPQLGTRHHGFYNRQLDLIGPGQADQENLPQIEKIKDGQLLDGGDELQKDQFEKGQVNNDHRQFPQGPVQQNEFLPDNEDERQDEKGKIQQQVDQFEQEQGEEDEFQQGQGQQDHFVPGQIQQSQFSQGQLGQNQIQQSQFEQAQPQLGQQSEVGIGEQDQLEQHQQGQYESGPGSTKQAQFDPAQYEQAQLQDGQVSSGQFQVGQFGQNQLQQQLGLMDSGVVQQDQYGSGKIKPGQFGSSQLQSGQFMSGQQPQQSPGQFKSGQVQSGQFESGQVQSGQFDSGPVQQQQQQQFDQPPQTDGYNQGQVLSGQLEENEVESIAPFDQGEMVEDGQVDSGQLEDGQVTDIPLDPTQDPESQFPHTSLQHLDGYPEKSIASSLTAAISDLTIWYNEKALPTITSSLPLRYFFEIDGHLKPLGFLFLTGYSLDRMLRRLPLNPSLGQAYNKVRRKYGPYLHHLKLQQQHHHHHSKKNRGKMPTAVPPPAPTTLRPDLSHFQVHTPLGNLNVASNAHHDHKIHELFSLFKGKDPPPKKDFNFKRVGHYHHRY